MSQIAFIDINKFYTVPVKKRGNYKKHPKIIEPESPWVTMQKLYEKLAGFFEIPLFATSDEVITQGDIRLWSSVYTDETFSYKDEICKGECFKVFEAELIGSENLYLEDRITVHKELLAQLEADATIEEAVKWVKAKFSGILR